MFDLLGSQPLAVRFFIAFVVVLILIGIAAWLVRRFGSNRLGGGARGRQPRLAVIDAATVDGRRRLVLIRRDNVEHLLMIGGPTDVVIEPNIVRAAAVRESVPARFAEQATRATTVETGWPLQPIAEAPPSAPVASPAPRAVRNNVTEEPWLPPEPGARPRPPEVVAEPPKRNAPDFAPPRLEPVPPTAPSSPPLVQNDHNLAEMAQQLEAALRRAPAQESRPPVTDPLAMPPPKPVDGASRPPLRDFKPRAEPKLEPRFEPKADKPEAKAESKLERPPAPRLEPKLEPKPESKAEPKLEAKPAKEPGPGKQLYDNLEEEMASLLGRRSGKS